MRRSTEYRFLISKMLLYGIVILCCMALIAVLNILLASPAAVGGAGAVVLAVFVSTVTVIVLDGLLAFLIRRLPSGWFSRGKRIFVASRRECRLYIALGVRRWKDKIPELGMFTGFHKNKVYRPQDNAYIARFILECNYGEVIHLVGALLGFFIVFLCPLAYAPWIGIPVAVVNFVLNLLPLFALRYNVPKLEALYALNSRKEKSACH
ncbi:MAG: hypothetical protein IJY20_01210 [Clostridia bacterium]|nr:hypothetical protein [Clostridia bacterium]